jgi:TonB family protein
MERTYADKQQAYRKRVLIAAPIATIIVALIFFASDVVPLEELDRRVGWEGETRLLPHVTILPDDELQEMIAEETRLRTMASMDLDVIDETGPAEGAKKAQKTEEPDEIETPKLDLSVARTFPVHTDVPYSEDYVILQMVQPHYPPEEQLDGVEGEVTLEVLVNEDGLVENAWVLAALGPKSFQVSALEAVRQFRFKPPIRNGQPTQMWIRFQVKFRLVG